MCFVYNKSCSLNLNYLKILTLWKYGTSQYTVFFGSGHWLQGLPFCIIQYRYSSHSYCDNKTLLKHCSTVREMYGYLVGYWNYTLNNLCTYFWSCCWNVVWWYSTYSRCRFWFSTSLDITLYGYLELYGQCCVVPRYIVWIYSWHSYE